MRDEKEKGEEEMETRRKVRKAEGEEERGERER